MKTYLIDCTKEFLAKSKPGIGSIVLEDGLDVNTHINEIETAKWLLNTFGGEITVLKEKNMYKIKTPDYEWDGKYWDLKRTKYKSSIIKAVKNGMKQIKGKQGGLIIDIHNSKYDYNSIVSFIHSNQLSLHKANGYIIIKKKKLLLSVLQIKRS